MTAANRPVVMSDRLHDIEMVRDMSVPVRPERKLRLSDFAVSICAASRSFDPVDEFKRIPSAIGVCRKESEAVVFDFDESRAEGGGNRFGLKPREVVPMQPHQE